jgi:peroxiredoxin
MSLQEKLDAYKAGMVKKAPKEALDIMHRATEDLRKIYLQFGIDVPKHNGDDSWTLPLPARYIIDRKGIVRYAEVSVDYTVRPEPENTITALKEL